MKKLSLAIAAFATAAALSATPSMAESNAHLESQKKIDRALNKPHTASGKTFTSRATTFTQRGAKKHHGAAKHKKAFKRNKHSKYRFLRTQPIPSGN